MAKPKLKIVETNTGEIEADIDELLEAREVISEKLGKAYNRKANVEADITSMELSLDLIGQKLDEAGYVPGSEE